MTGKADFTEQEWKLVLEGPPAAGLIVAAAQRGGTFREAFAISKSYVDARKEHGESELLDEIASAKPEIDRHRFGSPQELHDNGLQIIRDAAALVESKATPEEVEDYKRFVVTLAQRVAAAHREHGTDVSTAEQAAIDEISATLGIGSS
ncbi:MAG: hypothetical protein ACXVHB_26010 [Solirubrobacteraceae bacterium]